MNDLLQKAQTSPEAFGEIYEQTIQALYRYCMVLTTGDEDKSWDLCSETYLKAMKSLSIYEDKGYQYVSYLYRIARNLYIDNIRKYKKEQELVSKIIHQNPETLVASEEDMPDSLLQLEEEDIERAGFLAQIREILTTLKEDERELIYMRFEQDLKYVEIAHILDIPLSTIKVKYHRLYKKLQQTFAPLHKNSKNTL